MEGQTGNEVARAYERTGHSSSLPRMFPGLRSGCTRQRESRKPSNKVVPVEVGLHTVVLNKVISYLMYNKSTFPGYFTCGLVYRQWSFGGNRAVGLNGLPVILPRVMHISTAFLFTIFLMLVKPY
jgi:hypothetical protein